MSIGHLHFSYIVFFNLIAIIIYPILLSISLKRLANVCYLHVIRRSYYCYCYCFMSLYLFYYLFIIAYIVDLVNPCYVLLFSLANLTNSNCTIFNAITSLHLRHHFANYSAVFEDYLIHYIHLAILYAYYNICYGITQ